MLALSKNLLPAAGASTVAVVAAGVAGYVLLTRPAPAPLAQAPLLSTQQPAAPASAPIAPPAAGPAVAAPPTFDVVRVEPTGEAVVAGRATPNATVALLSDGAKIAEGRADASGAFVIIPPSLPAGPHNLALQATGRKGDLTSAQTVAVDVPSRAGGPALVALAAPDQPTRLLDGAAESLTTGVSIASVEAGENGAFFASGSAAPGAQIRLYANGDFIAGASAGADGSWTLKTNRKLAEGHYDMRAEAVNSSDGSVMAHAEAPFDYAAAGPISPADAGRSITVARGDNLWRISRRILGQGIRYTQIYQANAGQIRNPDKIWPGQVFVAPKGESD